MVAMFSPEQVDAHLGKMNNTIQYFPDTPEGRAEKAEEPVSKKEIDELKQMLKKKEEMDAKQNELIANESHINREQQKDIDSARDILGKKMQESESTILSVLESQ